MGARSLLLFAVLLAVCWASLEPIAGLGQATGGVGTFVSCDPGSDPCPDPWFPPNECNPWQPGCTPDYPDPLRPTPPPSGNPNGPEPTPPPFRPVPLDPLPDPDNPVGGRRLAGSCTESCSEVYSSCTSVCADSDIACTERCGVTNQSCMATCAQQPDPWEEHVKECERDCVGDSTCYDNCINPDAIRVKKAGVASASSRAAFALKDAQCEQMCNTAGAHCLNACGLDGTCNNRCIAVMNVCRTACEPPSVPACTTCSTSYMTCLNTCATTCGTDPSCLNQCNSACGSTDLSCLASCGSASTPTLDAPAASRLTYAGTCPSQCQDLWGWIACSNRNEDQDYCVHNLQLCMAGCQSDPDVGSGYGAKAPATHRAISALKDQATCQHGCDAAYSKCIAACDSGNGDCFSACEEVLSQCTFTCIPGRNVPTASATSRIVPCLEVCKSSAKDAGAKCKYAGFAKRCYQNVVRTAKTCEVACQKLSTSVPSPVPVPF